MSRRNERPVSFVMWLLFILFMSIVAARKELPANLEEVAVSDAAIVRLQEARP